MKLEIDRYRERLVCRYDARDRERAVTVVQAVIEWWSRVLAVSAKDKADFETVFVARLVPKIKAMYAGGRYDREIVTLADFGAYRHNITPNTQSIYCYPLHVDSVTAAGVLIFLDRRTPDERQFCSWHTLDIAMDAPGTDFDQLEHAIAAVPDKDVREFLQQRLRRPRR